MNRSVTIISIFLFSFSCSAQTDRLKPEFKNLSYIMDFKAAEVVSTLSYYFGSDSLRNDSAFVTQERYNLYYDSLTLWKMTKDAYKENNLKAKATAVGKLELVDKNLSNAQWLKLFDEDTRLAYAKGNNSTKSTFCIPSTYDNLKFFYKEESKRITSYNQGRIKIYSTQIIYDADTINYYLAFHKIIRPSENYAISTLGYWMPYFYVYTKPKKVVYPASIEKIWTARTGLPFSTAQELQIDKNRIIKILELPGKVNDEVLLSEKHLEISREYNIGVKCDSCDVKLYDNHIEDGDKIEFSYKNITDKLIIRGQGTNYKIILAENNSFYIFAISEGMIELCTIDAIVDGESHVFSLKQGERIKINLNKNE